MITKRRNERSGMTLVEVMVGMFLASLLVGSTYLGVVHGSKTNYVVAQHVSAFGLCKERLEHMRGVAFSSVTSSNFPTENITLTHLGGSLRIPLPCSRTSTIISLLNPPRKEVRVDVTWNFRNWSMSERVHGMLYEKDGKIAANPPAFDIEGSININPNNRSDNEFIVTIPSGTITRDDLHQDYPGYTGPALLVHVSPKGNGNQNSLTVDSQPYEVQNGMAYDISSGSMNVVIHNDSINPQGKAIGQWWIDITAFDATIIAN
ncbi:MAG: prepilin-type N-terminal cleavage/methylation domain-containing protein [Lentisphaerae bacterium]|nr:prepilin-type N-terminal cleavage/methylation domain-containing protein [Lentisphaerota bacterium]